MKPKTPKQNAVDYQTAHNGRDDVAPEHRG